LSHGYGSKNPAGICLECTGETLFIPNPSQKVKKRFEICDINIRAAGSFGGRILTFLKRIWSLKA